MLIYIMFVFLLVIIINFHFISITESVFVEYMLHIQSYPFKANLILKFDIHIHFIRYIYKYNFNGIHSESNPFTSFKWRS